MRSDRCACIHLARISLLAAAQLGGPLHAVLAAGLAAPPPTVASPAAIFVIVSLAMCRPQHRMRAGVTGGVAIPNDVAAPVHRHRDGKLSASVPRSIIPPDAVHENACVSASSAMELKPTTCPRSFTAMAPLKLPPSVPNNSLAKLPAPGFKVIALNTVMRYKGREPDPQSIGHDLAVDAIVVGRVVQRIQRPTMLSINAERVSVRDKSRMWGATYHTNYGRRAATQDEIATKISDNLQLRLSRDTKRKLTKRYTDDVEAYQLYLKGRYVWNKYTEEGWT
jgi:tetratricopeptide (TPR) repeat protein